VSLDHLGASRAHRHAAARLLLRALLFAAIPTGICVAITPLLAQVTTAQRPKDSAAIIARGLIRVAMTKFDLPAFHWRQ
jgi:hypothetical protein